MKKPNVATELLTAIGGQGKDPADALRAMLHDLKGANGMRLVERCGGKMIITIELNTQEERPDSPFKKQLWRADAQISSSALGVKTVG